MGLLGHRAHSFRQLPPWGPSMRLPWEIKTIPSPGGFPATLSKSQTFMHPSINDVSIVINNAFFTVFKVIHQISKLYFCAKISKYYKAPLGKLSFETGGLDSFNQYFLISLKKDVIFAIEKKKTVYVMAVYANNFSIQKGEA